MSRGSAWAARQEPQKRRLPEWEDKRARRQAEFTALIPAIAAQVAAEVSAAVSAALQAARVEHHEGLHLAPTTTSIPTASVADGHDLNELATPVLVVDLSTSMPGTAMATSPSTAPAAVLTACAVRDGNLAARPPTTCSTICPGRAATSAVSTLVRATTSTPATDSVAITKLDASVSCKAFKAKVPSVIERNSHDIADERQPPWPPPELVNVHIFGILGQYLCCKEGGTSKAEAVAFLEMLLPGRKMEQNISSYSSQAGSCVWESSPWDPGQQAIDSTKIICARGILAICPKLSVQNPNISWSTYYGIPWVECLDGWALLLELCDAWFQFSSCFGWRILLSKGVMCKQFFHPSITRRISYQEMGLNSSYTYLQLHIFTRHSELVTSLGLALVLRFLDAGEILGTNFDALLKYICMRDKWNTVWSAWGSNHCQWQHVPGLIFLSIPTEILLISILDCHQHESLKHSNEYCNFQVLQHIPWPSFKYSPVPDYLVDPCSVLASFSCELMSLRGPQNCWQWKHLLLWRPLNLLNKLISMADQTMLRGRFLLVFLKQWPPPAQMSSMNSLPVNFLLSHMDVGDWSFSCYRSYLLTGGWDKWPRTKGIDTSSKLFVKAHVVNDSAGLLAGIQYSSEEVLMMPPLFDLSKWFLLIGDFFIFDCFQLCITDTIFTSGSEKHPVEFCMNSWSAPLSSSSPSGCLILYPCLEMGVFSNLMHELLATLSLLDDLPLKPPWPFMQLKDGVHAAVTLQGSLMALLKSRLCQYELPWMPIRMPDSKPFPWVGEFGALSHGSEIFTELGIPMAHIWKILQDVYMFRLSRSPTKATTN